MEIVEIYTIVTPFLLGAIMFLLGSAKSIHVKAIKADRDYWKGLSAQYVKQMNKTDKELHQERVENTPTGIEGLLGGNLEGIIDFAKQNPEVVQKLLSKLNLGGKQKEGAEKFLQTWT